MRLTQVRIRQFRQFDTGLDIAGLAPGINIFYGPNESGKSTLAQAIRAAFLERHSTGTLAHLQPWGDSAAAPQVTLEFNFDGRHYQLDKRFMRQRLCDLRIDGQSLDGDKAEQHLADLLGYSVPKRGASQPGSWGVPGLLWIEQGAGQELDTSVQHAHTQLQGILDDALGDIASSDGDQVQKKVQERLARLVTPATAAPTRDYKKALDEQQHLQDEAARLQTAIHAYQQQVDRLAELQNDQARSSATQPWVALRQNEQAARQTLAKAQEMELEQQRKREALLVSEQTQQLLHDQLKALAGHKDALAQRERQYTQRREQHDGLTAQLRALEQELSRARCDRTQAQSQHALSQQIQQRRDKQDALSQIQKQVNAAADQLEHARRLQTELIRDRQTLAELTIAPDLLVQLEQMHDQLQRLEARHEVVATRLRFELNEGQSVMVDGLAASSGDERLLTQETTLTIAGVGRIHIVPGGDDLASLTRQTHSLKDRLNGALVTAGVGSLVQARRQDAQHKEMLARIRQHEAILALHAPDGVDALAATLQQLQQRKQSLQQDCDALEPSEQPADVPDLASARAHEQATEAALNDVEARLQQHRIDTARAQMALDTAYHEWQQAQSAMSDNNHKEAETQTLERLHHEQARQQGLQQDIDNYQRRMDAVRPDILEQDIKRYAASADREHEAHAERERMVRELKGRLQALGAQGLEEEHAELLRKQAAAERRVAEFQRTVAALSLLNTLLHDKKQALTRQLHAPLSERLLHYLQLLFGSVARIHIGDDLTPQVLARQNAHAPLHDLSFGAREQLGTISRLAYADLLAQAGKPTLIMLDDALVHSDDQRLSDMKRILFDAAQRHQILLFTCHPDRWRDLGATPRAIQDYRL